MQSQQSRILYDVPCVVCRDNSSGKHYGVFACDGCAGFFKRSVRRDRRYACKGKNLGACTVDKVHRNQCRACRFAKCLAVGMNKDAVQHERGPRNSTIRRQMALFLTEPAIPSTDIGLSVGLSTPVLDIALPKHSLLPPLPPVSLFHNAYHSFNRLNILGSPMPCHSKIISPPSVTAFLINHADPDAICEAAAKLLFMNVKWTKKDLAFASLSLSDRLLLLEESWHDLFLISCTQYLYPIDLKIVLDAKHPKLLIKDVEGFQLAMTDLSKMYPDPNEYACVRAIALFNTSFGDKSTIGSSSDVGIEMKRLQDLPAVAAMQEHSKIILNEYIRRTYPLDITRSSRLLQIVSNIRRVSRNVTVELFFRATIGDIPIEKIIVDMYTRTKDIT